MLKHFLILGRHLCLSVKLVHSFSLSNHSYNIDFLVAVKIIGANWRLQSFNYISRWHRTGQSSVCFSIRVVVKTKWHWERVVENSDNMIKSACMWLRIITKY